MIENINNIILISVSIINTFLIGLLIMKGKNDIAIGLATIQSLLWIFKFLKLY